MISPKSLPLVQDQWRHLIDRSSNLSSKQLANIYVIAPPPLTGERRLISAEVDTWRSGSRSMIAPTVLTFVFDTWRHLDANSKLRPLPGKVEIVKAIPLPVTARLNSYSAQDLLTSLKGPNPWLIPHR